MFSTKKNIVLGIHETYDEIGEAYIKCVYGCILRPHVLQGLSGTGTGWVYLDIIKVQEGAFILIKVHQI